MEATTYQTAALIDRGAEDYMLETAILKVFTTEVLWQGVYETLQVFGGQGYFSNEPYERMMRNARINTIGEGANEVLKAFIAVVGMRDIGEGLERTLGRLEEAPVRSCQRSGTSRANTSGGWCEPPSYPWQHPCCGRWPIRWPAGRPVRANRRARLDRPPRSRARPPVYPGKNRRRRHRAGDFRRAPCRDGITRSSRTRRPRRQAAAELYLRMANRRFDDALRQLNHNDDRLTSGVASDALRLFANYESTR